MYQPCDNHSSLTLSAPTPTRLSKDDRLIKRAIALLERRLFTDGPALTSTDAARDYLRVTLIQEPHEVFAVVFLNSRHQVIACETLFRGTINGASVYPRVVVQKALAYNAAALIIAHQHPSGCSKPSGDDRAITTRLKSALALVDIRVLDHFIVGKGEPFSFASAGLL